MKTSVDSSLHTITLHHGRSIVKIDEKVNGYYYITMQRRSFDFIQIAFAAFHMWAVFALLWNFAHSEMTVGSYIIHLGLFVFFYVILEIHFSSFGYDTTCIGR